MRLAASFDGSRNIEIAQTGIAQAMDAVNPGQHLLHQQLALAVGIRGGKDSVLLDRRVLRLAIDGSRRRKDQPVDPAASIASSKLSVDAVLLRK